MLLVIDRTTRIRENTVLTGDPIAVLILTHNPYLSSVSRYPVAFELPRAEARHHQPDLPRAPTPRAFARVSSLPIAIHPNIRYRTYLVLLFNTTGEEILVLFVQSQYTWLLGLLVTFCFKEVFFLAQQTQSNARVACFLSFVTFPKMSLEGGMGGMLNLLNVRVQRFMSIWHSNEQSRSGTDYTVSRHSP